MNQLPEVLVQLVVDYVGEIDGANLKCTNKWFQNELRHLATGRTRSLLMALAKEGIDGIPTNSYICNRYIEKGIVDGLTCTKVAKRTATIRYLLEYHSGILPEVWPWQVKRARTNA